MRAPRQLLVIALNCWLSTATTLASADTALATHDLNPLLSGYLPPTLASRVAAPQLGVSFAVANLSLQQANAKESLDIDTQVTTQQLIWQQPFNNDWQWQIVLPVVRLSGGHSDHFIEQWHNSFNLPNGNRDNWPQNRLLIDYRHHGQQLLLTRNIQSLGDAQLSIGHAWMDNSSLWFTATVPTGNLGNLSDALKFSATLSSQQTYSRWLSYQQVNLTYLAHPSTTIAARRWITSGSFGVGYQANHQATEYWQWLLQLDAHTSAYHSELPVLGHSVQLSVGPRFVDQHWQAELSLSEDIIVDSAPDIQAQLSISRHW